VASAMIEAIQPIVLSVAADEHPVWRGHRQEAKRGPPGGQRITGNYAAMGSFLLPCATTGLSLLAVWCVIGAAPRGQPWTPAVTLLHVRDGLRVRLMVVVSPFRRPSRCRPVHRPCMRTALRALTPIVPVTACHQRNDTFLRIPTKRQFRAVFMRWGASHACMDDFMVHRWLHRGRAAHPLISR
jgi:hypothetical protein